MKKIFLASFLLLANLAFAAAEPFQYAGIWLPVTPLFGASRLVVKAVDADHYRIRYYITKSYSVDFGVVLLTTDDAGLYSKCGTLRRRGFLMKLPGNPKSDFNATHLICPDGSAFDKDGILSLSFDTMISSVGAKTKDAMGIITLKRLDK